MYRGVKRCTRIYYCKKISRIRTMRECALLCYVNMCILLGKLLIHSIDRILTQPVNVCVFKDYSGFESLEQNTFVSRENKKKMKK